MKVLHTVPEFLPSMSEAARTIQNEIERPGAIVRALSTGAGFVGVRGVTETLIASEPLTGKDYARTWLQSRSPVRTCLIGTIIEAAGLGGDA